MGLINPETGSDIEIEDDGDFTVTFSMALPPESDDSEQT
jgi:hypothetical protein